MWDFLKSLHLEHNLSTVIELIVLEMSMNESSWKGITYAPIYQCVHKVHIAVLVFRTPKKKMMGQFLQ